MSESREGKPIKYLPSAFMKLSDLFQSSPFSQEPSPLLSDPKLYHHGRYKNLATPVQWLY
jgi:hypothetical protein